MKQATHLVHIIQFIKMNIKNCKSKLGKYNYYPDTQVLYWEWQPATMKAKWNEIQEAMIEYAELSEQYNAPKHIINEQQLQFAYIPVYQEWIDKNISSRVLATACKKYAIVKSEDIFIEVAVQQIFEEENASKFIVQLFDTLENAEKWINN